MSAIKKVSTNFSELVVFSSLKNNTAPSTILTTASSGNQSNMTAAINTTTVATTSQTVGDDGVPAATKAMRAILGKSIKCTLNDGRTATGTLLCMDRLKNLILINVIEERWIDSSDYSTTNTTKLLAQRELSQAMIPGTQLAKVELDKMVYDAKMAPHLPVPNNKSTTASTATST